MSTKKSTEDTRRFLLEQTRKYVDPKREVSAARIEADLRQDKGDDEQLVYSLRGKRISGDLDLRYRSVKVAVDIQDCEFLGTVDIRDCEFTQPVNFSGCTFNKAFCSGSEIETHTIYRKDLICEEAVFLGGASFRGCRVESGAYFDRTRFLNANELLDFRMAYIEKTLRCRDTIFVGSRVAFRSLKCNGAGYFDSAVFESDEDADFSLVTFGKELHCTEATFTGETNFQGLKCGGQAKFGFSRFEGDGGVSFRGASLRGEADFTGTTFQGPAHFISLKVGGTGRFDGANFNGAAWFYFASFAEDLLFNTYKPADENEIAKEVIFRGTARFDHVDCGGKGEFFYARFDGEEEASFRNASFGGRFVCHGVEFQGSADFSSIKCADDGFIGGAIFRKEAIFSNASFNLDLVATKATFERNANFLSLQCGGSAWFEGAKFQREAQFSYTAVGGILTCCNSTFEGRAIFWRMSCDGIANFADCTFKSDLVDLRNTSFGAYLHCDKAKFNGAVYLDSLRCGGNGEFDGCIFEGRGIVSLTNASFAGKLSCHGTTFRNQANFTGLRCGDGASFSGAKFKGHDTLSNDRGETPEGFRYAYLFNSVHIEGDLTFKDAEFVGSVNLTGAIVSGGLILSHARFERRLTLYDMEMRRLFFKDAVFSRRGGALDLRACTFDVFDGSLREALEFAKAQNLALFSRDPYVQLERYYESIGDDAQAQESYYRGRRALRNNARKVKSSADFTLGQRTFDTFLDLLTGYGTKTSRTVVFIIAFLILGAMVFSPTGALVQSKASGNTNPKQPTTLDRLGYDVDLFIPVANLQFKQKWEPKGDLRKAYAIIHGLAGWLLIPLFVASWSGILLRSR